MAEALVDDLEAVDVEQQDRDRIALGAGGRRLEGLDDPLDQALSRGQAGDRVPRGQRLLVQPRVLEGERGQLGELQEGVDLGLPEGSVDVPRREPEHADDATADGQRHADHGADASDVPRVTALELVVVLDEDRLARGEDLAPDALRDRHREADVAGGVADAGADRDVGVAGFAEVDVAVLDAEEARGAIEDRVEELVRAAAVEEAHRRFVERGEELVAGAAERRALGHEQRLVGRLDQRFLCRCLVRVAGDADADRHVRALSRPGSHRSRGGCGGRPLRLAGGCSPEGSPRTRRRRSGRRGRPARMQPSIARPTAASSSSPAGWPFRSL